MSLNSINITYISMGCYHAYIRKTNKLELLSHETKGLQWNEVWENITNIYLRYFESIVSKAVYGLKCVFFCSVHMYNWIVLRHSCTESQTCEWRSCRRQKTNECEPVKSVSEMWGTATGRPEIKISFISEVTFPVNIGLSNNHHQL